MQLLQIGRSSPHFILRLRQVRHPVLVLLRSFGFSGIDLVMPLGLAKELILPRDEWGDRLDPLASMEPAILYSAC